MLDKILEAGNSEKDKQQMGVTENRMNFWGLLIIAIIYAKILKTHILQNNNFYQDNFYI